MSEKKYIYGIDLGTTYSCIAYVDDNGIAQVIENLEGTNTTPSVVFFPSKDEVIVGQAAKDEIELSPDKTVDFVKRLIGSSNKIDKLIHGEEKSPEEISSYILKKVVSDAEKSIGSPVKDVVITCPAYFGTEEREATKNAGILAGLNVLELISEPTAAALYYGITKSSRGKTVLVYDLGGGTFDVTVLRIDDSGDIEVVCSGGERLLGGYDWDKCLVNNMKNQFYSATGFTGDFNEDDCQAFAAKAEEVKKALSQRESKDINLKLDAGKARITVTREDFDKMTADLLETTLDVTKQIISEAKEKGYGIDEILLVGGSTRMPQVREMLVNNFHIEPKFNEPDEAVAKGAAIYALGVYENKVEEWKEKKDKNMALTVAEQQEAVLYEEEAAVSSSSITGVSSHKITEMITMATTKSYALITLINGVEKCENLIIKNQSMPYGSVSVTKPFYTVEDYQRTVELRVCESDILDEVYDVGIVPELGKCTLKMGQNLPKGSQLDVTFTLNKEGILHVHGKDVSSNNYVDADMQTSHNTGMSTTALMSLKEKTTAIAVR